MKIIYKYDDTGQYESRRLGADDELLKDSESYLAPVAVYSTSGTVKLMRSDYSLANGESHDCFDNIKSGSISKSSNAPSAEMQAINALGIQVAQLTAKFEAQTGGAN